MSKLTPSNVEGLAFQNNGVIINTDSLSYDEFIRRRNIMQNKDREINILNDKINNLQEQINAIALMIKPKE